MTFKVPADALYSLIWQGYDLVSGQTTDQIIATRQSRNLLLVSIRKDKDKDVLEMRDKITGKELPTSHASAVTLISATSAHNAFDPAFRSVSPGLVPKVDRAVSVVSLLKKGITECDSSVEVEVIGIYVGCLGFRLPGPIGDAVMRLDHDYRGLLDIALKSEVGLVRELASGQDVKRLYSGHFRRARPKSDLS